MEIVRLRSIYQNLEKKNNELLLKLEELTKKNNLLSKENISLKYSQKINGNIDNNIEDLNKKIKKIVYEKNEHEKNNKKLKNINNELIKEKNDLEKKLEQSLKEKEFINKNLKEMSEIKDNYRDKYQRVEKELNNEKQKLKILQKKFDEIHDNINDINILDRNNLNENRQKISTHKKIKLNKISEIEIEKLSKLNKISNQSPQLTHKSISRFSTNNTYSTKKISNNLEDTEITPDNYNIVKIIKINNLKWFLFKKIKNNINPEDESIQPLYRRYQYLKLNSKRKKEKDTEESYNDYLWIANKDKKDFINFNLNNLEQDCLLDNEKEKKINELEIFIKELNEKLAKKEKDYNRINLNYAKLLKMTKKPEMNYNILLEENYKLKNENKVLKRKLEKIKENQNFIGISFIGDDLENSTFIDDKIFENILEDITKNRENQEEQKIITMKCFISNENEKNFKENIKKENNNINNNSKEIKRRSYKDLNININNKNIIRKLNKEYIKEILIERKKSKEIIHTEKEKNDNMSKDNEKNKINNFYHQRYHKSIKNTRNINKENDLKNEKINTNKTSILKKIKQKSFNLDSSIKIENKENREKKIIFSRKNFLKENKEINIKSKGNK